MWRPTGGMLVCGVVAHPVEGVFWMMMMVMMMMLPCWQGCSY